MAFNKTGVAVTKPKVAVLIEIGTEKDGKFWDGKRWVSKEEFEKIKGKRNG